MDLHEVVNLMIPPPASFLIPTEYFLPIPFNCPGASWNTALLLIFHDIKNATFEAVVAEALCAIRSGGIKRLHFRTVLGP